MIQVIVDGICWEIDPSNEQQWTAFRGLLTAIQNSSSFDVEYFMLAAVKAGAVAIDLESGEAFDEVTESGEKHFADMTAKRNN